MSERARREPACRYPGHRHSDWALRPESPMWVCGICHPPVHPAVAAAAVYRDINTDPPRPTPFDMRRYHELRDKGVGRTPFDKPQRSGFWKPVVNVEKGTK